MGGAALRSWLQGWDGGAPGAKVVDRGFPELLVKRAVLDRNRPAEAHRCFWPNSGSSTTPALAVFPSLVGWMGCATARMTHRPHAHGEMGVLGDGWIRRPLFIPALGNVLAQRAAALPGPKNRTIWILS